MNKAQLVEAIADKLGGRQQAADAVDHVLDAIVRAVVAGERVSVTGFGSFEKVDRPARYARNPQTGERVRVKKTSVPRFPCRSGLQGPGERLEEAAPRGEVSVKKAPKGSLTGGAAATVKKAAAKKTTKAAAKKAATTKKAAPAKKTTAAAKKTTAKKAPAAKKTTTAAAAKTTTAKKTTAKKTTAAAKKAPAKKVTAKKAPAKKSTARKTTAKKTTARKATS